MQVVNFKDESVRLLLKMDRNMTEMRGELSMLMELVTKMYKEANPDYIMKIPIKQWDDRLVRTRIKWVW